MKPLDRVEIKSDGQVGVIESVDGEFVTVLVSRADGWPFPSYLKCPRKAVRKIPKQVPVYEPAPF